MEKTKNKGKEFVNIYSRQLLWIVIFFFLKFQILDFIKKILRYVTEFNASHAKHMEIFCFTFKTYILILKKAKILMHITFLQKSAHLDFTASWWRFYFESH